MRTTKTFRQILEETADANSRRLADRARLANWTAKISLGLRSKRLAYGVKRAAIERGVAVFPSRFALSGLEEDGRLARVQFGNAACFHLPVGECGVATRGWIEGERRRISSTWRRARALKAA
jgi:predicted transcriptional regulator of viral defense system